MSKRENPTKSTRRSRFWLWLGGVMVVLWLASLGSGYAVIRHFQAQLPDTVSLRSVPLDVPLRVYSADGKLLGEFGLERRAPLTYEQFPPALIHAFLASEDDRFFSHPGVDWQGLLRAAGILLTTGEKSQGGSTITMQLARNLFLTREKTYGRKVKEILLAMRIEREMSKKDILTRYLNQIYLGHRAFGVAAGARAYFGKEVEALSLGEMAVLAGLPKAPSRDNPLTAPERAKQRRNYVLRRMRDLNYIDAKRYGEALKEPIHTSNGKQESQLLEADYVAEMVRAEMVKRYGDAAYTNGYQVTTTINSEWQAIANRALRRGLLAYDHRHGWRKPTERYPQEDLTDSKALDDFLLQVTPAGGLVPAVVIKEHEGRLSVRVQKFGEITLGASALKWAKHGQDQLATVGDLIYLAYTGDAEAPWQIAQIPEAQSALVSLDPNDGAIRALVGGFEFWQTKFNRAVQAQRQPGSSFKPFLYSAALEHGFSAASVINDAPVVFEQAGMEKAWRPENYSGKFYGPTRLRKALVRSQNLVSVRLLMALGVDRFIRHASKFGFPASRLPKNYSISLGTAVVSPLEMAAAYGVFANGGYEVKPYFIAEIKDYYGKIIEQAQPKTVCVRCPSGELPERAISAQNAFVMTSMMQDVVDHGTAIRAKQLGRSDLAGKTGTTNDCIDAWFAGFNANLTTVVWVGNDQLKSLGNKETGSKAALPIWMEFMGAVLKDVPSAVRPQPAGVVARRIDPESGQWVDSDAPNSRYEWFITREEREQLAANQTEQNTSTAAPTNPEGVTAPVGPIDAPVQSMKPRRQIDEQLQQTLQNLF